MLSLDISCHHQIRLKQQSTRLSTIIESILDTNVAYMCVCLFICLASAFFLYRILPYLLTLIVGVLVVLSFGLYPPSGCTMAYLAKSCLPNLLGSIQVRIWGQDLESVSWDTQKHARMLYYSRLWGELEFHSRFCFLDVIQCRVLDKILYIRKQRFNGLT